MATFNADEQARTVFTPQDRSGQPTKFSIADQPIRVEISDENIVEVAERSEVADPNDATKVSSITLVVRRKADGDASVSVVGDAEYDVGDVREVRITETYTTTAGEAVSGTANTTIEPLP